MKLNLDSHVMTFPCPKCGKQLKEKVGRMKRNKHVSCAVCGQIAVDAEQLRRIEDGLNKQISKLGGQKITIKL